MKRILVTLVAGAVVFGLVSPAHARTYWSNTPRERNHIVHRAKDRLGARYCWGGTQGCYDCSGLTLRVFLDNGATLPHSAADQFRARHKRGWRTVWKRGRLHPGDLVFFKNTYTRGVSHAGIYIGHQRFIHASDGGVRRDSIRNPYYRHHWKAAVRPKALRSPRFR